jgi:16S rRNA (cytosine967-C5)-methyltransferase
MFDNTPAPLTLRANPLRVSRAELVDRLAAEDVVVRPARFAPDGFVVEEGHPLAGGGFDAGWFVVQDEASQLVALLAGRHPGPCVLDACAAPGGKTTAIAAAMQGAGLLVACDVRGRRIDLLRRTIAASGASCVRIVQADLLKPLPFGRAFECVLVDAPCSGLGTLRRDPDIRWRRHESDLATLAAAQLDMLANAADVVAPGGRLIYATCSSEPEENEAVADRFLAGAPQFVAVDARLAADLPATVVDGRGHLRTLPYVHGLEAFFGAVFERQR